MKAKQAAQALVDQFGQVQDPTLEIVQQLAGATLGLAIDEYKRQGQILREASGKEPSGFAIVGLERGIFAWIQAVCDRITIPWINKENLAFHCINRIKHVHDEQGLEVWRQAKAEGIGTVQRLEQHLQQQRTLEMLRSLRADQNER